MQIYNNKDNQHVLNNNFIIAFDEFNDIRRKLFDIPEIDKFLFFQIRKIFVSNINPKKEAIF